ncbi:hypothetical protein ABEF94_000051, partial [Exophiala dermatitidis]
MSLPRLFRAPCATRALTQSALKKPESSLRLLLPTQRQHSSSFSTYTSRRRQESLSLDDDPAKSLPGIDPSKLEVTKTITPKELVPNKD